MNVIVRQQACGQAPVEMTWARNTDEIGVMLSVAQLLQHAKDETPWSPDILEIHIEL